MEAIMTAVTTLFTGAMEMAGDVGSTVAGTPLLLTFAIIPIVGLGVGLFKRLININ